MIPRQIGTVLVWVVARGFLTLAALVAALVQAGPLPALALAATIALLRPLRRGWLALVPVLAVAPWSPLAAALLVLRALVGEAFLLVSGGGGEAGESGLRARRAHGVVAIHRARRDLLAFLEVPVADSGEEAEARLAAARRGSRSEEDAAFAVAGTAWAEARPWRLIHRVPGLLVTVIAGGFADEDEEGETSVSLAKGLLVEMVGPPLIAGLCVIVASIVGAVVFPAEPLALGPVVLPGALVQFLAVLGLGLGAATLSCGGLVVGGAVAWVLARSHFPETIAIAVIAGVAAAAGRAALQKFTVAGFGGSRRPREPFNGPRQLRGNWRAAVDAMEGGRLAIAVELFGELLAHPACVGDLRAQTAARLALCHFERGDLDAAAATLAEARKVGSLPPQALPAAGAVAAGLGDLEEAERLLAEALDSLPNSSRLRSRAVLTLADVCARRQQPERAIELVAAQRESPWSYDGMARLLESEALIATALVRQGDAGRARKRLDEILDFNPAEASAEGRLSRALRRELVTADGRVRLVAGEIALAQGRYADAEQHLHSTLGRLDRDRDPHLYACARALHGVALAFGPGGSKARQEIDAGVRLLESRRTQLRRADHRTGLILAEADLYSWCLKALEQAAKQDVFAAAESAAWLIESLHKNALAELLRGEGVDLPEPTERLLQRIDELEATAKTPAAEAEIETLRAELAAALSERFATAYVPTPTSVGTLRDLAKRHGNVLSFHLPGGKLPGWRVWIRRDCEFEVSRVEARDNDSAELLERLGAGESARIAALHAPPGSPDAAVWASLASALLPRALAESLRDGAEGDLPPLLIAPDGVLGLLPWSALALGDSPLGTLAAIQVVPSLGVVDLDEEPAPNPAGSPVLAYLDPSLAGREEERRLLEDNFDLTLAGTHADFLAGLAEDRHAGAYLAAHGDGLGLEQNVELAGGRLSAGSALRAPWPEWTLFASCLVGRVPLEAGLEPLGLPISCVLAGSRSVLSAMFEVPSATLPSFIEPVLAALAAGSHPAVALARAQRDHLARNPHASVAECLAFVCMTHSPGGTDADAGTWETWEEVEKAAQALIEGDPDQAREVYRAGLEVHPDPALFARYASFLAETADEVEEAGRVLKEAVASAPDHVELRRFHAWYLHRHTEDHDRIRAAYEAVLDLDPDDRWAPAQFARFLRIQTEELEHSARHYRRALECIPSRPPMPAPSAKCSSAPATWRARGRCTSGRCAWNRIGQAPATSSPN